MSCQRRRCRQARPFAVLGVVVALWFAGVGVGMTAAVLYVGLLR